MIQLGFVVLAHEVAHLKNADMGLKVLVNQMITMARNLLLFGRLIIVLDLTR